MGLPACLFPIRALPSSLHTFLNQLKSPLLCDRQGGGREGARTSRLRSLYGNGAKRPMARTTTPSSASASSVAAGGLHKYRPCLLALIREHPREIFSAKCPSASHFLVQGFANLSGPRGARSRSLEALSSVVVPLPPAYYCHLQGEGREEGREEEGGVN